MFGEVKMDSALAKSGIIRYVLLISLSCIFFSGCDQQQLQPLRVGSNIWPGYEPLYLARDQGYYNETLVHMVELPSSTITMRHLRSGTIDAACLTLDEVFSQLEAGLDLQVVLLMDYSNGADVMLSQPEIKTLQQLKGKTIGVENTAVGAIILDGALQSADLKLSEVRIKSLKLDEHERAFRQKRVDAVVTFEPIKSKIEALGGNIIFDSGMIPGRIIDVLVVRKEYLRHYPDNMRSLIRGYFRARKMMHETPDKAYRQMAGRLGVAPEKVPLLFKGIKLPSLADNRRVLDADAPQFSRMAEELEKFLIGKNLLAKQVNTTNLGNGHYLPELRRE